MPKYSGENPDPDHDNIAIDLKKRSDEVPQEPTRSAQVIWKNFGGHFSS